MSTDDSELPRCPLCGEPYAQSVAKPFRHMVECDWCGEPFNIDGNPDLPLPTFRRPFWTDQFRDGKQDSPHQTAALDGLMIACVMLFGLALAGTVVAALLNPAMF